MQEEHVRQRESDIAVRVCNHFVSRNRPVIPIHDSFIVCATLKPN